MSHHIQTLLDDVLSGRRVIHDPATFRLLRKFAPDKTAELNELETQAHKIQTNAAPAAQNTMPKPRNAIHLTRNDLEGILHHGQSATIDEVEWLLAHANDPLLMLSYTEETELRIHWHCTHTGSEDSKWLTLHSLSLVPHNSLCCAARQR
jgi:hypothetical protein